MPTPTTKRELPFINSEIAAAAEVRLRLGDHRQFDLDCQILSRVLLESPLWESDAKRELIDHVAWQAVKLFSEDIDSLSEVDKFEMQEKIVARSLAPPVEAVVKVGSDEFSELIREGCRQAEIVNKAIPQPLASVSVSKDGKAIEITLDNSKSGYSEWIKGEGADIGLMRDQETDRVIGAHLSLYAKSLYIGGTVLPTMYFDLESGKQLPDPLAAHPAESDEPDYALRRFGPPAEAAAGEGVAPQTLNQEWCDSIGASASFLDDWWQIDFTHGDVELTILQRAIQISDGTDSVNIPMQISTRAEVLLLCAALGIPITTKGT